MFQIIKSKVTDISNKTDGKISEVDQSSDQKWQTLGRLVEDLSNKVETICFPSGVLAHLHMTLIHPSSVERFSEISSRKLWYTSSFLLERTDFKNLFFEKIHWAHSEDAEVAKVKQPRNPKQQNF